MQTLYDGGSFYTLSEQSNSWVIGNYFKDSCLHGEFTGTRHSLLHRSQQRAGQLYRGVGQYLDRQHPQ